MNIFQKCRNTTDAVPLYLPQQLFLKPMAVIRVSIQLPNLQKLDKSISHWEIMEQVRTIARPDEFSALKVTKTTKECIKLEAEIDNRTRLERVISKLDCTTIKLKDIPNLLRLRANEIKLDYPTRQMWDDFFGGNKDMDEMKPGHRPDTIHISHLPIKWFMPHHLIDDDDVQPSEKMFHRIFEKFGPIRSVDIPICDHYRDKMKDHISGIKTHTFDDKTFFEGYIQFKDYLGFSKTIDAFKGMKLLRKEENEALSVHIKMDFDRNKHLSEASIKRREILRERLIRRQKQQEDKEKAETEKQQQDNINERQKSANSTIEKEKRRKEREEKRKSKVLETLKINSCDELNEKIAKEEKKLLKAQRKLEAIRLVEDLFRRIKEKKQDELLSYHEVKSRSERSNELQSYKKSREMAVENQRRKLHNAIEGRVMLKNILCGKRHQRNGSSSSEFSSSSDTDNKVDNNGNGKYDNSKRYTQPNYNTFDNHPAHYFYSDRYRNGAGPSRGRPFNRYRGFRNSYRGGYYSNHYSSAVQKAYIKYFSKFLSDNKRDVHKSHRRHFSSSRSKSYSRSRSRTSSSRSRSRSRHRTRTRSRSRRCSARSGSRFTPPVANQQDKSRSKTRSKDRSKSVDSSTFVSRKDITDSTKSASTSKN